MTPLNLSLERTPVRSFLRLFGIAVAVLLLLSSPSARADVTWTLTGTGDWSVATNWSGGVPASSGTADIYNGGTATITTTGDACSVLSLGNTAGSGFVQMTGGGLNVSNSAYVGYTGTGNFTQSGGSNTISIGLYLGYNAGSSGTYSLSGTGQLSAQNGEYVGYSGTGNFTQSGGTNILAYYLYLGGNSGSSGAYSLSSSGLLSAESVIVGYSGTGNFTQSGGTNAISSGGDLVLGENASGSGAYSLSHSGQLSTPYEYVGLMGTGYFTQTGGTNAVPNYLFLGVYSGSSGSYNLSGSGLLSSGNELVGDGGTGNFTQSGGTNAISSALYLANNPSSSGTYSLSGSGQLSAPTEHVGHSGTGIFTQSGGTNTISSALYLGYTAGSSGTYSLSSSGLLSATNEYIGYNSAATALFQQTGGTNSVTYLSIGSGGRYQLGGGTLQIGAGLIDSGIFDGGNSPAVLSGSNCILDFSAGTLQNVGSTLVNLTNSLLIVPPGFNTSTAFSSSSTLGLTHTAGTTLVVPAGQGFGGWASINDPVNCQGTITAAAGSFINLNNGLVLSGTGAVSLGSGALTVSDTASGISGGSISAYSQNIGIAATGVFTQTGGTNSVTFLSIGSAGRYQLGGGVLQINGGLINSGLFDGGNSPAVLSGSNCILDLTAGSWQNLGAIVVSMDTNSLLIVPAGFDPSTAFSSSSSFSLTHTAGTTLVVPAGQGFGGWGSVNDPVNCQGAITAATGSSINLNNGVMLSGTGTVSLGSGTLTVSDTASGISGGSLSVNTQYVGNAAGGLFTQTGGTSVISGISVSVPAPAATGPTALAVPGSCPRRMSTWPIPARGTSRRRAAPTPLTAIPPEFAWVTTLAAAEPTGLAVLACCPHRSSTWVTPARGHLRNPAAPTPATLISASAPTPSTSILATTPAAAGPTA